MAIDLKFYAERQVRIPAEKLTPLERSNTFSLPRTLAAHFIDFHAIFFLTLVVLTVMETSLSSLMVTNHQLSYFENYQGDFTLFLFPAALGAYFYFCHFLNHGQTWGMFLMKRRATTPKHCWQSALRWTFYSLVVCYSFGLFTRRAHDWIESQGMGRIAEHDHLYWELLREKSVEAVDLHTLIPAKKTAEVYEIAA